MADSQGNVPPEGTQGDGNTPKYVTAEELNRAITARFSDHQKKLEKHLDGFSTSLMGKLEDLIKTAPPSSATAEPTKSAAESPEFKGLMKQMAELEKVNQRIQLERDAERTKSRDAALRQNLSDALIKHGVDATRVKHAVGILVDSEKRVRFEDDGETLVFKDTDNTDVDLLTGVKSWVKSDDGKFFLPPRGVNGSGDRGAGKAPMAAPKGNQVSPETLGQMLLDEFAPR